MFTVQSERVVAKDNTVTMGDKVWQIGKTALSEYFGRMYGDDP